MNTSNIATDQNIVPPWHSGNSVSILECRSYSVCQVVFILVDKLMPSSDLLVAGCFLLAITIITAYLITSDGIARSKQLAIRQGQAKVSGIIHTCTYILYLRNEDTILIILWTGIPITTTIAGEW